MHELLYFSLPMLSSIFTLLSHFICFPLTDNFTTLDLSWINTAKGISC